MNQKNKQCPDCGSWMLVSDSSCKCGWKDSAPAQQQRVRERSAEDIRHAAEAKRWCQAQGLKTTEDKIAFCKRIVKSGIGAGASGREWAHGIVRDYEAGEYHYRSHYLDACKVVGKEPIEWRP